MNNLGRYIKAFITFQTIFAVLLLSMPTAAQDLVAVSDITGGSSVFVFRSGSSAPKRIVARTKTARTKTQRVESARKLTKQYTALAKVEPRRSRSKTVAPTEVPTDIATMAKDKASIVFAGVGEYWMDRDDYNQGIDLFRESLNLDPTNARAQTGLSEALALKGNELLVNDTPASARKFFEEALKYNPKNAPAYFGLGEVLTDLDLDDEAVANYEKALASDKDLTEIYLPLAILYFERGDIAKAETLLVKSYQMNPNDSQTQMYLGLVRYTQGNRDLEALTLFQKAIVGDPAFAEAYLYIGETLMRLKRPKEAIPAFSRATSLKTDYFEAWLGLGAAEFADGNYPNAIVAFKQATKLKNDNATAYENLADAYRQNNNFNDAEANYNLAALFIERTKDMNKEQAADIYSMAAFMIGKQCEINKAKGVKCRWDVAIRHLEKATALSENSVDAANLGWAYYNAAKADLVFGRTDIARPKLEKAKLNLQKAAAADSKFIAGPLMNLGMALTDLGDFVGAEAALKRVVEKEPNWAFALNELGSALRRQNKFKEAIVQFKKATEKNDKFDAAYFNLGEAQYQAGNIAEAKKAYEKLRKLGSNVLADKLALQTKGTVLN